MIGRAFLVLALASCGARVPAAEPSRPTTLEDVDGFQDGDGVPDPDNDGDGNVDTQDQCPCHAEDADGFEDEDGCPDPDNDRDRIVDACDRCPNDTEVYNGLEDLDGCPDRALIRIVDARIQIMQHVYFDKDSVAIRPEAEPLLDALAAVMRDNPQIELVEVQGHAALRERDAGVLAQRRAEAVVQALVSRGVAPGRLRAQGYGTTRPIATNDSPAGREHNRRVDFRLEQTAATTPMLPAPSDNPCPDGPPPETPSVCVEGVALRAAWGNVIAWPRNEPFVRRWRSCR